MGAAVNSRAARNFEPPGRGERRAGVGTQACRWNWEARSPCGSLCVCVGGWGSGPPERHLGPHLLLFPSKRLGVHVWGLPASRLWPHTIATGKTHAALVCFWSPSLAPQASCLGFPLPQQEEVVTTVAPQWGPLSSTTPSSLERYMVGEGTE